MNNPSLAQKWGEKSLKAGWVAIPSSLLFLQDQLGISPTGMNIIMNLVLHWWGSGENPFPAQAVLARRIGVSQKTIQREIASLEAKGLIEKKATSVHHPQYKGRNVYDLSPLVKKLQQETVPLTRKLREKNQGGYSNGENGT